MPKGFNDPRYRVVVEQLIAARKARGIEQKELGEALGYHQQFVSRFETGERRLDLVELVDVATLLDIDLTGLMETIPRVKRPMRIADTE